MNLYLVSDIYLSDSQKQKINKSFKSKKPCSLRLSPKKGKNKLKLTQTQYSLLIDARKNKKSVDIVLSPSQLQLNGGFLPFLIGAATAAAPFIAKSLAGTAISAGINSLVNKIRGKGSKLQKTKGKGYIIPGTEKLYKR